MRRIILLFVLLQFCVFVRGYAESDSLLTVLDREILNIPEYELEKEALINQLKDRLRSATDLPDQYSIIDSIAEAYESYKYDSAFSYCNRLNQAAYLLKDPLRITHSRIRLGFIYISSGMFKEAVDTLTTIDASSLRGQPRADYFAVTAVMWYSLADHRDGPYREVYEDLGNRYVDSILELSQEGSYNYLYYRGLRAIRSGDYPSGEKDLSALLMHPDLSIHQKAIIYSTLSDISINKREYQEAIRLLSMASLCDIRSAIRETAAILNLANILYMQGDIKRSFIYTHVALDDANFYGARQRKIQVGSILPIIEEEKINTVEKQKRQLLIYAVTATSLALIVVLFTIIILRQLRKLKKAENKIIETNLTLLGTNEKLIEANKIKEGYIGYYFNVISDYIEKIEQLKGSLEKNLMNNKFDTVRYIVNNIDLKKERTKLYQGFDRVFLTLFPDFVNSFNALFNEEDRIILAENDLLNTDLRIFALIRLGITENDQIARILDFSVNTIYTYKTKVKNKSFVPNEEFEKRVMEIRVY